MDKKRLFGLLMPISALPSDEGIGTFGDWAYKYIDYMKAVGAKIWQVLPVVPTNYGDSPYQSCCSSALNYYFIDLKKLVSDGLLTQEEFECADLSGNCRRVDYGKQFSNKISLLRKAFTRFNTSNEEFVAFINSGRSLDFAVFMALKCKFSHKAWTEWNEPYRSYNEQVVFEFIKENEQEIIFWQFTQYIFLVQWSALKDYAHRNGIKIMGDIPLYLAHDSVEMWKYGNSIFKVDENRRPECVAGVPPDAFTEDGQLWGNPLYDWEKMERDGFTWWNERLKSSFELFDILRIDHFRGFDRYYAVPVGEKTARKGRWENGPSDRLFADKLDWNIIAEDLGIIDDGVRAMMKKLGYPGMKILEFAFDGHADNEHKPSNYTDNCVCYTGTHDNLPLGQYIQDLPEENLKTFIADLKAECKALSVEVNVTTPQEICRTVVRLAIASKAFCTIIPLGDLLAMGGEARINLPATVSSDNWSFRFVPSDFDPALAAELKDLIIKSDRI